MIKEYKFDKRSKWRYYYKIILITLSAHFLTAVAFLIYKNISDLGNIMVVFSAITIAWLIFFMFPLTLLFLNHRKHSKSSKFRVENENYFYKNDNISLDFKKENIQKIELILSPPSYDKRIDFLYFGKFHFTKIFMKNDKTINISCLILDNTNEIFGEELIERKKKFFPIMKTIDILND